jgi:hypothetical protein
VRYASRVGMAISRSAFFALMLLAGCGGREANVGSGGGGSPTSSGIAASAASGATARGVGSGTSGGAVTGTATGTSAGSGASSSGSGASSSDSSRGNGGSSTGAGEESDASAPGLDGGIGSPLDTTFDAQVSPFSWDGSAPPNHRASDVACPQQRAPGSPCPDGSVPYPPAFACASDSDCTGGKNGRCFGAPAAPGQGGFACETLCSYDECFTDSDCPAHVPCACRVYSLYGNPNVCLTSSDCAVDSDCGDGGFCSLSTVGIGEPAYGYFCITPSDLCVTDTDCSHGFCAYDLASAHRLCYPIPPMR